MTISLPAEVSVEEVQTLANAGEELLLLDCRSHAEFAVAHLPSAKLVPMEELHLRVAELMPWKDKRIIVYCHHGMRSELVADWLRSQGFPSVQNMTGGVDAWAIRIDTSLPRY